MKTCRNCKVSKTKDDFYKNKTRSDGLTSLCKNCFRSKYPRSERPRKDGPRHRRVKYGLTEADYQALLKTQGGKCAICLKPCSTGKALAVDHNHDTGQVRGLLCMSCNTGLGKFKDDRSLLLAALNYLRLGANRE